MILLAQLIVSVPLLFLYASKLRHSVNLAPQLEAETLRDSLPKVSVIIPAYNEAENISDCITAVLKSSDLGPEILEVLVVDDKSTDNTLSLAENTAQQLDDARLKIIKGQARPTGQIWVGKNWACTQAVNQAKGEYFLFIDADVRLEKAAIESALSTALKQNTDLLTCAPAIVCGCLAEWLVQPLMINHLLVCFDMEAVNDAGSDTAFAAGPFMLFRRSAYEKIGGHQGVAAEVVEDVELARRVKGAGLNLRYCLAPQLATVRMYRSWGALWEGWTKNLYLGAGRSLALMVYMAVIMVAIYVVPWIALAVLFAKVLFTGLQVVDGVSFLLVFLALWQQYDMRLQGAKVGHIGTKYWWLSGAGGLLLAAIPIGSAIKTETGWGWTWRGRTLMSS